MVDPLLLFGKVLFSAALGGLVGVEREFDRLKKQSIPIGIRTMILFAVMGTLIVSLREWFDVTLLLIVGLISILILSALNFYVKSKDHPTLGLTTYTSSFITYFVGVFVGLDSFLVALIIALLNTVVLSISNELKRFVGVITREELKSAIIFLIIAFVILPLLPNEAIDYLGVFNPFRFWLIVVLISGVSFVSYVLLKYYDKAVPLVGFFGGLISSKATIVDLASKPFSQGTVNASLLAILASAITSLGYFLISGGSFDVFFDIMIILILSSGVVFTVFYSKGDYTANVTNLRNPFTLINALKIGGLIFIFTQATFFISGLINPALTYLIIALTSIASSDAAAVSVASLSPSTVSVSTSIIIVLLMTILDKLLITWFVKKELFYKLVKPLIIWSLLLLVYPLVRVFYPVA